MSRQKRAQRSPRLPERRNHEETQKNANATNLAALARASARDLPVFPNITTTKIIKSAFHIVEDADVQTDEDLQELLSLLFDCPEREFYYFHEKDKPLDRMIAKARDAGQLLINETEFFTMPTRVTGGTT